ncbi:MAG: sensor histidine kinase, partial [Nevskiales bacterium]
QTTTDWFVVLMAILIHRYYGLRRVWLERGMLGFGLTSTLLLATTELDNMFAVANLLHGVAVLLATYVFLLTASRAWRGRRSDEIVLALGFGAQSLLGLHDWLLQLGLWGHENWYLLHYGSPLFLMVMAWLLSSRFIHALAETETLNAELEQRVERKRRQLEESYASMQALQREQVVAEERERIMRDLHDGLGGQLVSALAIAQRGEGLAIQQTLREALDDLRLVIDSLDPMEGDLPVLLGSVRGRLEPQLTQQGLRFEWQVQDMPAIPGFGPDKALQVLRILQEAIANILKHAKARTVTVRTGTEPAIEGRLAGVFIEVLDDGVGLQPAASHGRGLNNMQSRAERIGGRLQVQAQAKGTSVRLWLPLPAAA